MKNSYLSIEVIDRTTFQRFLELLLLDFKENRMNWENDRIELFLEAMASYTEDLDGYYQNNYPEIDPDNATWRTFADILKGAVIYE
jgi:hypothetical protein